MNVIITLVAQLDSMWVQNQINMNSIPDVGLPYFNFVTLVKKRGFKLNKIWIFRRKLWLILRIQYLNTRLSLSEIRQLKGFIIYTNFKFKWNNYFRTRAILEEKLPLNDVVRNYKKYIPKVIVRRHGPFPKKYAHDYLPQLCSVGHNVK